MRFLFSLFFLISASFLSYAQTDTLISRSGEKYGVPIKSIDYNIFTRTYIVNFRQPVLINGRELDHSNASFLSAIRFRDGFQIPVEDGQIRQDWFLNAPTLVSRFGHLSAEGVFPLSDEQVRARVGNEAYELGYRPIRNSIRLSTWRVGVGAALLAGTVIAEKDSFSAWEKSDGVDGLSSFFNEALTHPVSRLNAAVGVESVISSISGLVLANYAMDRFVAGYDALSFPSRGRSVGRVVCGSALALAGAATMGIGFDHSVKSQDPNNKGWLVIVAGSALANLGIDQFAYGLSGLKGHSRLKNEGLEHLSLQCGPTPSGYGLSLAF